MILIERFYLRASLPDRSLAVQTLGALWNPQIVNG